MRPGPKLSFPHTATLWRLGAVDEWQTQTFGAPIPVRCRWDTKSELFIDAAGQQAVAQHVVAVEDQEFTIGDVLAFGTVTDVAPPTLSFPIRGMRDIGSIDGSWNRARAYL